MNIPRLLISQIVDKITGSNKVIVVYGARQTGKTTLAREIISGNSYLFKDVFELLNLRKRQKLYDLLRLLAF